MMRVLDLKLLRDLRRLWTQSLAISAVLAVGVMIMVMSNGAERSLRETRDTFYERNRFGDIFASASRAPDALATDILAIDGVARVDTRISTFAILDIADMTQPAMGQVLSLPSSGLPAMNIPTITRGRIPEPGQRDEVLVNQNFAQAHGFSIGDQFGVTLNGQKRMLTITGTALSPEFIYTIGPNSIMPDDRRFGILWMDEDVLGAAFNLTGAFNDVSVQLGRNADPDAVTDALDNLLKPYGGTGAFPRKDQISNAFLDGELKQLRVMAEVVPPVFLVISAFLVNMVLGRLIALEREQIGLLKALGYQRTEISWHYIKLALVIGCVGVGLGWTFGMLASRGMAQLYAEFFHFPYLVFVQYPSIYAISAGAGLMAAALGAVGAVRRVVGLSPAVAMAPPAPTRFRRGVLDRLILWLKPRQPTMMILRSIGRWPFRAALTTFGIATSASVMIAALFMFDAMDELLDVSFVQINRQDAVLQFAEARSDRVVQDVAHLPGVMAAEGVWSIPARLTHGHLSRRIGVEGRRPGDTLSRVIDTDSLDLVRPEHGIVLARRLADHLDVGVGDAIEVEFLTIPDSRHKLIVTGLAGQYFGLGAYMEVTTLARLLDRPVQVTHANLLIDPAREEALFNAIKGAPAVAGLTLLAQVRQSFTDTIAQNAGMTTTINSFLAALIAIGVVYNSARIQLSERARELASLRILGFTRGEVSYILLGELFLLTLAAIPLGLLIGRLLAGAMVASFDSDLYAIPLVVSRGTYMWAAGVVAAASVVSALIVRRRIDRMDLIAVMKTRE
ncbi:FtsX-like permease family protein [Aliiroseovarius sediminis]|uniref:ABC transporter permease n=1 Tax=Aliiroseovarius sediminis TaxID=2925839 RepID=UPI001F5874B3|nr:FtsX-like permease family protein [Aliiroseovarius sediminis]MCI2393988.1 ABC transporter permease [Aliiroseovarius sediminis]